MAVKITQLTPYAVPGQRYASFAGKPAASAGHPVGRITQLMPYAVPGQRYGSFAGKAAAAAPALGLLFLLQNLDEDYWHY